MGVNVRDLSAKMLSAVQLTASRKRVNFLIAGVQKSGTSALDAYMREHPDICMADTKEVHFFDRNRFFIGVPNYFAYHSFFSSYQGEKMIGEATPIYSYWKEALGRIRDYNQNMKMIFVLRNPITRAYSHWNMMRQRGDEHMSFLDAINAESERIKNAYPRQSRKFSYVDRGWYSAQIERAKLYFPSENILVLRQEKLREMPEEVLSLVWEFLNIDHAVTLSVKDVHTRRYEHSMDSREFDVMREIYRGEIDRLENLMGWDCSDWLVQNRSISNG